ncbi:MAG: superoxide dismutase [Proteobacteria bacterium]|nr:MAG: superoxide dismutase [Pseudomonadota bacterium]
MKLFSIALGALLCLSANAATLNELNSLKGPFKLAPLPYANGALKAAVDAKTMEIHHDKHHQGYVDNLNKNLGDEKGDLRAILANASQRSEAVRNNAGGHWNHSFFWSVLTPKSAEQKMPDRLAKEIDGAFGSFDKFKEAFEKAAAGRFGSGWAWLIRDNAGKLAIVSTPNQDNPLMDLGKDTGTPIFGLDVWEHAYYLRYQNKRPDYLKNMWKIVNWKQVDEYDQEALKK